MPAFNRLDDEEDDVLAPKEPQVTSDDPAERKAARALRIKRRQEAIKRAEQPLEEAADEEPGAIEQATAAAAEELQRLALDGAAKVTNVKVTTDEREVIRRAQYADKLKENVDRIEEEATQAQIQYEAITLNWDAMMKVKDPLDIDQAIREQRLKCDELLEEKNVIIDKLKGDLRKVDEDYFEDLNKQDNDIKELGERIEKQIKIMQRAYEKQLSLIDEAINFERAAMLDHNNKRWEALYKQRDKEEVAHMEYKSEQLEQHKLEIESIMWDHHEKFREAKIELETLIQELQKELEKLKATCIINTEKIGYNYQVLKKREEENVFVRSQQKRKLNQMYDVANKLRQKIRKAVSDSAIEEMNADAEIVKIMQAMEDIENKSGHFAHVNNYKFSQVWRMTAARCSELSKELRSSEVAIHAHVLSEPPPAPPQPPPKSPLVKYEKEFKIPAQAIDLAPKESEDLNNAVAQEAKKRLVRHILQLVADNTGFLVEDRLLKLLEKYPLTSRNLCTLDSIFMALEIQAEEDIELLCKTFLNYAFCPICVGFDMAEELEETSSLSQSQDEGGSRHHSMSKRSERLSIRIRTSVAARSQRSMSASTSRSVHYGGRPDLSPDDQILMEEAEEIVQKYGDSQAGEPTTLLSSSGAGGDACSVSGKQVTIKASRGRGVTVSSMPNVVAAVPNHFLCPVGHHLEIEPMNVLTALGGFIAKFVPPEKKKLYDILDKLKPPDFTSPSRQLHSEEIEQYWAQWKQMFPAEKDKFWDGLLAGLNNYLSVLQERERIHEEVLQLRRRNAALRRLVRGALPELPRPVPQYAQPYPPVFVTPFPDETPQVKLPPILK